MELKFKKISIYLRVNSSNCTFMELKLLSTGQDGSEVISSNCTFMELKYKIE